MLIGVLVTFLVIILVLYLINMMPLDGRAKQICRVIVIILGVISLLKYIAVLVGILTGSELTIPQQLACILSSAARRIRKAVQAAGTS